MSYALIDVPGGAETYSVPFPYINRSHVKVMVNGVLTTSFSWINNDTVSITPTPGAADKVRIYRNTSQAERLVDFRAGVAPTETSLDTDSIQAFYLAQESLDRAGNSLTLDPEDFLWDARGIKMKNVAPATDDLDVPLFGQIKPSVDAAQAAQAAAVAARNTTLGARDTTLGYRNDAQAAAALAATFVPDNYYTEAEVDDLLDEKADVTAVDAALAVRPTQTYVDDADDALAASVTTKVSKSGDTMTGPLTLSGNPTNALEAAPKQYVDTHRKMWESAQLTIAAGGSGTLSHDLGARAKHVQAYLVCVTPEHGYTAGMEVPTSYLWANTGRNVQVIISSDTQVQYRIGSGGLQLPDASGNAQNPTNANWRLVVRAWR